MHKYAQAFFVFNKNGFIQNLICKYMQKYVRLFHRVLLQRQKCKYILKNM